jgi:pimeloyl-ACP methyl ester carboxylesterase
MIHRIFNKNSIATIILFFITFFLFAKEEKTNNSVKTVVLIHGLFQNSYSWQNWKVYFEERGYQVYVPSFPFHDGLPSHLQNHIDTNLVNLDFKQVLDSIRSYVDNLPEKPILIGHSIGRLITQKLVEEGKAYLGITLATANPRGVSVMDWKYIRSNFRMVNTLRRRDKICTPPFSWFQYTFLNTLDDSTAMFHFNKYFIPESRIIAKSSTAKGMEIDFEKPHVPMLFISGQKDNDLPPSLIYENFKSYKDPNSINDCYEFSGKSHYIVNEPNWEAVAEYIIAWVNENKY